MDGGSRNGDEEQVQVASPTTAEVAVELLVMIWVSDDEKASGLAGQTDERESMDKSVARVNDRMKSNRRGQETKSARLDRNQSFSTNGPSLEMLGSIKSLDQVSLAT